MLQSENKRHNAFSSSAPPSEPVIAQGTQGHHTSVTSSAITSLLSTVTFFAPTRYIPAGVCTRLPAHVQTSMPLSAAFWVLDRFGQIF